MAKSKKVKKTTKKRKSIPWTEEERLENLIRASENAITKQGTSIDDFFKQQSARLKKELEVLRAKK